MPKRFQRSRKKGARLPDGVVCVTRPGKWGNPYSTAAEFESSLGLLLYLMDVFPGFDLALETMIKSKPNDQVSRMLVIAKDIAELRGKDLACFCGLDRECHGDALLKFANRS